LAKRRSAVALVLLGLALPGSACASFPVAGHSASATGGAPAKPPVALAPRDALEGQSDAIRAAFEALRTADEFQSTHIGEAGVLSPYVEAFRIVLAAPRADELFRAIYARATLAGKLYALAGFYFTDSAAFETETARLAGSHDKVKTFSGCIV